MEPASGWRCLLTVADITNLLQTEREGRTGEYWPEVVAVRTERSEVRTKTTEGQYSTVRLEQARLVSSLLYGTLSLIVKCTSGGLHLKMFVSSIYLWNFGKFSIFLFSSDSFNVKNDIIHTFFSLFWLQNPDRERTNQSTGIWLRLGLPYNKTAYRIRRRRASFKSVLQFSLFSRPNGGQRRWVSCPFSN